MMQRYVKLDALGNSLSDMAESWTMVMDKVTGSIWERKTDDNSIHNKNQRYTWEDAQNVFIAQLNIDKFGGFSDWRLPTIEELVLVVNYDKFDPVIDTDYFLNTVSSWYWSSTTDVYYTDNAWCVNFRYGYVGDYGKSNTYYVRAVRNGR